MAHVRTSLLHLFKSCRLRALPWSPVLEALLAVRTQDPSPFRLFLAGAHDFGLRVPDVRLRVPA